MSKLSKILGALTVFSFLSYSSQAQTIDTLKVFSDAKQFIVDKCVKERPSGDYELSFFTNDISYKFIYSPDEYLRLKIVDSTDTRVEFYDVYANGLDKKEGDACIIDFFGKERSFKDLDSVNAIYFHHITNIKSLYSNRE
jgi:hypothetical protein